MYKTGVTQKIITDSGIIQHLIANSDFIYDYYSNYLEYQTRFGKILLFYGKNNLLLPLDNNFLKLNYIWYTANHGFNFISTI